MNVAGCGALARAAETRDWYRAILPQYVNTTLQTSHTRSIPSRFSKGGHGGAPRFDILYLAENPTVARFEVQAMLGSPFGYSVPNPFATWTIVKVRVSLSSVVDVTVLGAQTLIGTNAQELTGDWTANYVRTPQMSVSQPTGAAPTQDLGESLYNLGTIEGFLSVSSRVPTDRILVVFPQRLQLGNSIEFFDEHLKSLGTIRGKAAVP